MKPTPKEEANKQKSQKSPKLSKVSYYQEQFFVTEKNKIRRSASQDRRMAKLAEKRQERDDIRMDACETILEAGESLSPRDQKWYAARCLWL